MILEDTYRAYFKHQAENHPDLVHSANLGERVFEVIGLEESLGDFRTGAKAKGFIMRLLEYDYNLTDRGDGRIRKYIEAGFIIAHYHSSRKNGSSDYLSAKTKSEKVVDEIIEKIVADSRNGHPLFSHKLDSKQHFSIEPISHMGDGCYSGFICMFSFAAPYRDCITHEDAPEWLDEGKTPFEL